MTVLIPEGYGQFTLIYTGPMFISGGGATVLGFGGQGAPVFNLDEFAVAIKNDWITYIKPLTDANLRLERIHWAGPTTSGDEPVAEPGGRTGTNASPNIATLVSYTTGVKGRRGRGRSYFPGMLTQTEINEDGGIIPARQALIQTGVDNFFAGLDPIKQVVLQRDEPGQQTPPLNPPPIVTSRTVAGRAATQRRRLRR